MTLEKAVIESVTQSPEKLRIWYFLLYGLFLHGHFFFRGVCPIFQFPLIIILIQINMLWLPSFKE